LKQSPPNPKEGRQRKHQGKDMPHSGLSVDQRLDVIEGKIDEITRLLQEEVNALLGEAR